MDGRTDGRTDGWMDGLMDGWMDGWTDGCSNLIATPTQSLSLALALTPPQTQLNSAMLLSFLEQEYNDGAFPRLSFKVVAHGHVEMLRWMLDAGIDVNTPNQVQYDVLLTCAAGPVRTKCGDIA